MKYFTREELNPSEATLNLIRQLAHTYRVIDINNKKTSYCLN
ncbi:MAG: hypothetical protein SPJ90_06265 [Prevotella sp.]|nr:hypothetical protein [Prevotellaceae bacterium]MDY5844016.1 hypothetical protein [Prevotella sp.]